MVFAVGAILNETETVDFDLLFKIFCYISEEDFEEMSSDSDDESTIERDERAIAAEEVSAEVRLLQQECDMDQDHFLDSLPPEYVAQLLSNNVFNCCFYENFYEKSS